MSRGLGCLRALAAKTKPNQVPEGATARATPGSKAAWCHAGTSRLSTLSLLFPGKNQRQRAARAGHQRPVAQPGAGAFSGCITLKQLWLTGHHGSAAEGIIQSLAGCITPGGEEMAFGLCVWLIWVPVDGPGLTDGSAVRSRLGDKSRAGPQQRRGGSEPTETAHSHRSRGPNPPPRPVARPVLPHRPKDGARQLSAAAQPLPLPLPLPWGCRQRQSPSLRLPAGGAELSLEHLWSRLGCRGPHV
ncbi:uncharacterized protein LOC122154391 [Tyto alba]|uniref:uncharacterized protein LOC122154391 n=1 Tax=Tyto alba TaxID=56313 RepID=UPI001C67AD25|nr:uncharacterized protein LOC122154391 [Tyto alba]